MSFIKEALLAMLVFGAVIIGFTSLVGDLQDNYSTTSIGLNDSNTTILLKNISDLSNDIKDTMKPNEISTSQMSLSDFFTMGSSIVTNTASLILLKLPSMFINIISVLGEAIGLPGWSTQIILSAISIILTFAIIKFFLRRSP